MNITAKGISRLMLVLAFALIGVFGARAQQMTPEMMQQIMQKPLPIDEQIRTGRLENGMTYYIRANKEPKDRAEFYILHNVGAVLETDAQNGLAHFAEHMAFNGTKHFPGKKLIGFLEKNGIKFGADLNAFTTQDMTCYNISDVPTNRPGLLDSAMLVLCDWSGDISFEDDEIDAERGVISEEWRMRRNAQWRTREARNKKLLAGSKYGQRDVIGPLSNIQNFPYNELKDFYHQWYRPDMQAIIVVGDFDPAQMEARLKRMAGALPKRPNSLERPVFPIPDFSGFEFDAFTDSEISYTLIELDYKHETRPNQPYTVGEFRQELIRDLAITMLNKRFEEKASKGEAPYLQAVDMYGNLTFSKDLFQLISVPAPGKLMESYRMMCEMSEMVRQHGFLASEMERVMADNLRTLQSEVADQNKQPNASYVMPMVSNFVLHTPIMDVQTKMMLTQMLYQTITPEECASEYRELTNGDNVLLFVSTNSKNQAELPSMEQAEQVYNEVRNSQQPEWVDNVSTEPLMATIPAPAAVKSMKKNAELGYTEIKFKNGVKVLVLPTEFKDDEVLMQAYAPGGKSLVSDEDIYNADYAAALASGSGVADFDDTQLTKMLAGKHVSVSPEFDKNSVGIQASSSAELSDLTTMFQLTRLYMEKPRFDEKMFDRLTGQLRQMLASAEKNPQFVFRKLMLDAATDGSQRVKPMEVNDISSLSLDKMAEIYRNQFSNARNFTFVIVGKVDIAQITELAATYLGTLPKGEKRKWKNDGVKFRKNSFSSNTPMEMETPKTFIGMICFEKAKYTAENELYMQTIADILNLQFTAELREKEGGAYSVGVLGGLRYRPERGAKMQVVFTTNPDRTNDMSKAMLDVYAESLREISQENLDKVKSHFLKSYREKIRTNGYWLNTILDDQITGVNMYSGYEGRVNALTPASVEKAAEKLLGEATRCVVILRGTNQ